jgi:hypothetical protein
MPSGGPPGGVRARRYRSDWATAATSVAAVKINGQAGGRGRRSRVFGHGALRGEWPTDAEMAKPVAGIGRRTGAPPRHAHQAPRGCRVLTSAAGPRRRASGCWRCRGKPGGASLGVNSLHRNAIATSSFCRCRKVISRSGPRHSRLPSGPGEPRSRGPL